MNLTETVQALEAKNITIAINLGAHQHCAIDSNCPLAVELRRLMVDAGVTLEQLLEGFVEATAPDPVNYDLPEIDGKVAITIAGTRVELELSDVIAEELKHAIDVKERGLEDQQQRITHLGNGLYNSYLTAIAQARESPTLPQLRFSRKGLMKANCHITCVDSSYVFLFPTEYKPEYMVTCSENRTGTIIRYKMADRDIEAIKEEAWLELTVRGNKFLNAMILNRSAKGIDHYHGDSRSSCWGSVEIPRSWDGTLKSLCELKALIMNSLATINTSSMMQRNPFGKPGWREVFDRCTEIGEEGKVDTPAQLRDTAGRFVAGEEETPRARWGTRAGGTATATAPAPTEAQEYQRRWGVDTFAEAEEMAEGGDNRTCNLCGDRWTLHDEYTCPRDQ